MRLSSRFRDTDFEPVAGDGCPLPVHPYRVVTRVGRKPWQDAMYACEGPGLTPVNRVGPAGRMRAAREAALANVAYHSGVGDRVSFRTAGACIAAVAFLLGLAAAALIGSLV